MCGKSLTMLFSPELKVIKRDAEVSNIILLTVKIQLLWFIVIDLMHKS